MSNYGRYQRLHDVEIELADVPNQLADVPNQNSKWYVKQRIYYWTGENEEGNFFQGASNEQKLDLKNLLKDWELFKTKDISSQGDLFSGFLQRFETICSQKIWYDRSVDEDSLEVRLWKMQEEFFGKWVQLNQQDCLPEQVAFPKGFLADDPADQEALELFGGKSLINFRQVPEGVLPYQRFWEFKVGLEWSQDDQNIFEENNGVRRIIYKKDSYKDWKHKVQEVQRLPESYIRSAGFDRDKTEIECIIRQMEFMISKLNITESAQGGFSFQTNLEFLNSFQGLVHKLEMTISEAQKKLGDTDSTSEEAIFLKRCKDQYLTFDNSRDIEIHDPDPQHAPEYYLGQEGNLITGIAKNQFKVKSLLNLIEGAQLPKNVSRRISVNQIRQSSFVHLTVPQQKFAKFFKYCLAKSDRPEGLYKNLFPEIYSDQDDENHPVNEKAAKKVISEFLNQLKKHTELLLSGVDKTTKELLNDPQNEQNKAIILQRSKLLESNIIDQYRASLNNVGGKIEVIVGGNNQNLKDAATNQYIKWMQKEGEIKVGYRTIQPRSHFDQFKVGEQGSIFRQLPIHSYFDFQMKPPLWQSPKENRIGNWQANSVTIDNIKRQFIMNLEGNLSPIRINEVNNAILHLHGQRNIINGHIQEITADLKKKREEINALREQIGNLENQNQDVAPYQNQDILLLEQERMNRFNEQIQMRQKRRDLEQLLTPRQNLKNDFDDGNQKIIRIINDSSEQDSITKAFETLLVSNLAGPNTLNDFISKGGYHVLNGMSKQNQDLAKFFQEQVPALAHIFENNQQQEEEEAQPINDKTPQEWVEAIENLDQGALDDKKRLVYILMQSYMHSIHAQQSIKMILSESYKKFQKKLHEGENKFESEASISFRDNQFANKILTMSPQDWERMDSKYENVRYDKKAGGYLNFRGQDWAFGLTAALFFIINEGKLSTCKVVVKNNEHYRKLLALLAFKLSCTKKSRKEVDEVLKSLTDPNRIKRRDIKGKWIQKYQYKGEKVKILGIATRDRQNREAIEALKVRLQKEKTKFQEQHNNEEAKINLTQHNRSLEILGGTNQSMLVLAEYVKQLMVTKGIPFFQTKSYLLQVFKQLHDHDNFFKEMLKASFPGETNGAFLNLSNIEKILEVYRNYIAINSVNQEELNLFDNAKDQYLNPDQQVKKDYDIQRKRDHQVDQEPEAQVNVEEQLLGQNNQ